MAFDFDGVLDRLNVIQRELILLWIKELGRIKELIMIHKIYAVLCVKVQKARPKNFHRVSCRGKSFQFDEENKIRGERFRAEILPCFKGEDFPLNVGKKSFEIL